MARALVHQLVDAYADRAPKAIQTLEAGFDDATAVLALPEPYRRRLRTTNAVEMGNHNPPFWPYPASSAPCAPDASSVRVTPHEAWTPAERNHSISSEEALPCPDRAPPHRNCM
jgi:transposase-like protein